MSIEEVQNLCIKYLRTLDTWQNQVFNIRRMHHEVWNEMYAVRGIIQHRAGSRVEKLTRILPPGGKSDVDYMFEVDGVVVENERLNLETAENVGNGMYFRHSIESAAYGEITLADEAGQNTILTNEFLELVFQDAWISSNSGGMVLDPSRFKENVVSSCQFEMQKTPTDPKSPHLSPSIAGEGALNPYDAVPCLKLRKWPWVANDWLHREGMFSLEDKQAIVDTSSVFLVPAGNPMSPYSSREFRLSFSMIEIELVEKYLPYHRQLYGFFKLMFKSFFSEIELLSSYHLKVMMLWKIEKFASEFWSNAIRNPFVFVHNFMRDLLEAVDKQFVEHFFIKDCNIYPRHKHMQDKVMKYQEVIAHLDKLISERTFRIIAYDMRVSQSHNIVQDSLDVGQKLDAIADKGASPRYVCGYLTRLLSVCWYGLQCNERFGQLVEAVEKLRKVFEHYWHDKNIRRITPMIEKVVQHMLRQSLAPTLDTPYFIVGNYSYGQEDQMSFLAHVSFLLYLNRDFSSLQMNLDSMRDLDCERSAIGVTLTKFHLPQQLDPPFNYLVRHMTSQWKSNRVYIHPLLMYHHLRIQVSMTSRADNIIDKGTCQLLDKLSDAVEWMPDNEPYFGKLSYKYTGIVLLQGYSNLLHEKMKVCCQEDNKWKISVPQINYFISRESATNFDLR